MPVHCLIFNIFYHRGVFCTVRTIWGSSAEWAFFDAFDLNDGNKSIAFTITIQPTDNMSDTDLMSLQNAVISAVEKKCNAKIRDK